MRTDKKLRLAQKRHWRVRSKVRGTMERPRMSVCFSNTHIYVQFVDDSCGKTLASASTRDKAASSREKLRANVAGAKVIGQRAAEAAKQKGITQVVFDRGGARYHWKEGKEGKEGAAIYGKVAALAQAARDAGLRF